MAEQQKPRLMLSGLTNTVYLVTRYRALGDGMYEATGPKVDMTASFLTTACAIDEEAGRKLADALGFEIRKKP